MNEFRLEPPTSVPPPPPEPPSPDQDPPGPGQGSLAAGVGLAWLVMLLGELLVFVGGHLGGMLLPPVAIVVWAAILLGQGRSRTGKGMFLGLLSIVAVLLLLVAACFGLVSNFH